MAPTNVTGSVAVPRSPEFGLIEVTDAPRTVKGTVLLAAAAPPTVTDTLWAPSAAVAEMVKVALMVVGLATLTPLTVTPPPETATVTGPTAGKGKLVPVSVTGIVVARPPVDGVIEVNVGVGGIVTVKATVLLTPPGAVTLTFLAVPAAPAAMVKVVVTWVSLATVMGPTAMPPPDTVTAVAPVKPLPKILTGIATPVPRSADVGSIDVSTGPSTV